MTEPVPQRRWNRMSTSLKTLVITIMALALVIPLMFTFLQANQPVPEQGATPPAGAVEAVAPNSHYLDDVGPDAPTVVEFLDFECPACGSLYPYVEEIREYYDGDINYVVRHFPLSSHANALNASIAVEAAGQQGKLEEMFHRVFETQREWGGGQASEVDRFRGFAEDLGLDLDAYDAAVADPATEARVMQDYDAGVELGVTGTPTFFLDGEQLTLTDPNDLPNAIDEALGK